MALLTLWSSEFTDKFSNDNDLIRKFVVVYVDDILVFSKDFEQHLNHLEQVFNRLRDANLTLKPSKCEFVLKEVKYMYLGHIISKHGVQVNPSKTDAISSFPVPKTQKQVILRNGWILSEICGILLENCSSSKHVAQTGIGKEKCLVC